MDKITMSKWKALSTWKKVDLLKEHDGKLLVMYRGEPAYEVRLPKKKDDEPPLP